jgi:hypothetical protein
MPANSQWSFGVAEKILKVFGCLAYLSLSNGMSGKKVAG